MTSGAVPVHRTGRLLFVCAGLALGAGLFLAAGLSQQNEATGPSLPAAIQQLIPEPGTVIRPQEDVGVDLQDDLFAVIRIDGTDVENEIPEDQYDRVTDLGRVTFRPGPGKSIDALGPGPHTATAVYWARTDDRDSESTEIRSYTWTFKVG
jgi:hypothetical protein